MNKKYYKEQIRTAINNWNFRDIWSEIYEDPYLHPLDKEDLKEDLERRLREKDLFKYWRTGYGD